MVEQVGADGYRVPTRQTIMQSSRFTEFRTPYLLTDSSWGPARCRGQ
ncbi:hypothetical protein MM1S1540310_2018 [Mycobacteroides abscessus subsp. bolletii 1S-154-0310]|uniref:Uncharacterized protein n=1 Tax=Mycobacteroides abscessus MAB_091912_2446 TaxID=1335414 RepID=A0A829MH06_9MYCO|nr:hypothetical protein MM1S1510930_2459 [Mycobacteroides abscessus subsp. bolletii 1S-151-0930]EIU67474.1 hypothetical protein MM1S1520914_2665 [Mycobacteroides abscessus subsp. bolletii 1S-152-0914]EIU80269.1 hypothetical protein MM1S1540310_2018 [Mycobacteroides abscessus subsp. bolletii 1S-154-0310]EIU83150.1 hypothetical protein MM2B0626_2372 [Mycobacteroides abscessus subsp. bolletii 2B-0626]EIV11577.1 hypothetical protein MM2B0912R_2773 [Mycobacteroides abscessus subsp. bolletii 2B-0912-